MSLRVVSVFALSSASSGLHQRQSKLASMCSDTCVMLVVREAISTHEMQPTIESGLRGSLHSIFWVWPQRSDIV